MTEPYFATRYARPRDEVLGAMQDEGWATESSGDVAAPTGFFARISNVELELIEIHQAFDEEIARMARYGFTPAELLGHFLLVTNDQGFVAVTEHPSEPAVKAAYDVRDAEYGAWLGEDES